MTVEKVEIQSNFTPEHLAHPKLPHKLSMDKESLSMFKAAPENVAFTGIVNLKTNVLYLHPLVATRAGNESMKMHADMHHDRAGNLDGLKDTKPILHPNMTPALRAKAGLTAGHHQICNKHKFELEDCVGFAVKKSAGANKLTTNSRTLNSDKFVKDPQGAEKLPQKLKRFYGKPQISDGALSMKWAALIAVTLELEFIGNITKTRDGHFEAPF